MNVVVPFDVTPCPETRVFTSLYTLLANPSRTFMNVAEYVKLWPDPLDHSFQQVLASRPPLVKANVAAAEGRAVGQQNVSVIRDGIPFSCVEKVKVNSSRCQYCLPLISDPRSALKAQPNPKVGDQGLP